METAMSMRKSHNISTFCSCWGVFWWCYCVILYKRQKLRWKTFMNWFYLLEDQNAYRYGILNNHHSFECNAYVRLCLLSNRWDLSRKSPLKAVFNVSRMVLSFTKLRVSAGLYFTKLYMNVLHVRNFANYTKMTHTLELCYINLEHCSQLEF